MNSKQRAVIEAARRNPPRFLEVASKIRRFTAFDNFVSKMTPERRAEFHAAARIAWAEKERLATKSKSCPALEQEFERLIRNFNRGELK